MEAICSLFWKQYKSLPKLLSDINGPSRVRTFLRQYGHFARMFYALAQLEIGENSLILARTATPHSKSYVEAEVLASFAFGRERICDLVSEMPLMLIAH